MQTNERLTESSVRRKARRLGFAVRKSRRRTFHANDHGEYMLVNSGLNACVLGRNYNSTLSDIDVYLTT